MKDELQTKLVEILSSIQSATGKASDFAMEQLPDIAQSYVMYGRAWATFDAVMWLLLLPLVSFLIGRSADRHFRASDDTYPGGLLLCGGAFASAVCFAVGTGGIKPLMLVWFAPKAWLLKEIASLVK